MIKEYKYRAPFKYICLGFGGLVMSSIFGLAMIRGDGIWFSIIVGIFSLIGLALAIGFLTIYFRELNTGNLKLGNDFIEVPGRWKERVRVNFKDILGIGEFDTYDNVIEIESKHGTHLIERNWMKQKEFDNVKIRLQQYWINK